SWGLLFATFHGLGKRGPGVFGTAAAIDFVGKVVTVAGIVGGSPGRAQHPLCSALCLCLTLAVFFLGGCACVAEKDGIGPFVGDTPKQFGHVWGEAVVVRAVGVVELLHLGVNEHDNGHAAALAKLVEERQKVQPRLERDLKSSAIRFVFAPSPF